MSLSPDIKCSECGNTLTAAERLLAAIFGADGTLCSKCCELGQMPKCHDCGKPTTLSFNDIPLCPKHLETTYGEVRLR